MVSESGRQSSSERGPEPVGTTPPETAVPEAPSEAHDVFGSRVDMACTYARILARAGIERGLIGPRELPRLWERHILNSAVVAELIESGSVVADVGSGAGLPGVPVAIARPELHVVLIEPLLRRSDFLTEVVSELELGHVTVRRARAEEIQETPNFDVVTARAVAPMARLASWTLPLVRPGGRLLALKGQSVSEELNDSAASLARMGAVSWRVEEVGRGVIDPVTRVALVEAGRGPKTGKPARGGRRRRKNT